MSVILMNHKPTDSQFSQTQFHNDDDLLRLDIAMSGENRVTLNRIYDLSSSNGQFLYSLLTCTHTHLLPMLFSLILA